MDAAQLPAKQIDDADGWSFWPQCIGKTGRPRDWIYCYYFPCPSSAKYNDKYSHYEVSFARNKRFKLYNGDFFDTTTDVLEKAPLTETNPAANPDSARTMLQQAISSYPAAGLNANRPTRKRNEKKKK